MSGASPSPFGRDTRDALVGRTILQLVPRLDEGPESRATLDVARALTSAGARALVASERGGLAGELQAFGGLHAPFPAATRNPLAMALNVRRLQRLIETERVALVHARSRAAAWVALGACRRAGAPLVTTHRGAPPSASALKTRYDSVMTAGDRVLVSSDYAADAVARAAPEARERLRIVRPGVDLTRFAPEAVSPAKVARLRESWGVAPHERVALAPANLPASTEARLVAAAESLRAMGLEDVRYILVGDADSAASRALQADIARRGLTTLFARVGPLADRPAALLAASVVLLPIETPEGVGRSAIEALAMGAPTVVADLGAGREIVTAPPQVAAEARTGWLAPPGDAGALARAIAEALSLGASAREALRRRARASVGASYSLERMTDDTLAVYREILAPTRAQSTTR